MGLGGRRDEARICGRPQGRGSGPKAQVRDEIRRRSDEGAISVPGSEICVHGLTRNFDVTLCLGLLRKSFSSTGRKASGGLVAEEQVTWTTDAITTVAGASRVNAIFARTFRLPLSRIRTPLPDIALSCLLTPCYRTSYLQNGKALAPQNIHKAPRRTRWNGTQAPPGAGQTLIQSGSGSHLKYGKENAWNGFGFGLDHRLLTCHVYPLLHLIANYTVVCIGYACTPVGQVLRLHQRSTISMLQSFHTNETINAT